MSASRPKFVHLVVIIHGLWGTPEHVAYLAKTLAAATASARVPVDILCPESIQWTHTYDGIDFCAERVAQELDKRRAELEDAGRVVTKFSCVGYSLGGLIARFLVGLLHSRTPSFFDSVEAINFTTFASPWVGMPNRGGVIGSTVHFFGARSLSRTGTQLYLIDKFFPYPNSPKDSPKYPLLAMLAHPATSFYKALTKFQQLTIYANAINDRTVPFVTGASEKLDGFMMAKLVLDQFLGSRRGKLSEDATELKLMRLGGLRLTLDPEYPALVKSAVFVQDGSPPTSLYDALTLQPTNFFANRLPALPFFMRPKSYPFRTPYNYMAAVLSPILAPIFLMYVLSSFLYQSRKSRQRIRLYSVGDLKDHSQRVRRVGLFEEVQQEIFEDMVGSGNAAPVANEIGENLREADAEADATLIDVEKRLNNSSEAQSGTQYSLELSDSVSMDKMRKQHGLSSIQCEMLENINRLPGLVKYFAFFDGIPNSHGAIIYRAHGLSDPRGKMVGIHWAERFIV